MYYCLSAKKDRPTWLFKEYLRFQLYKGETRSLTHKETGITTTTFHDNNLVNLFSNCIVNPEKRNKNNLPLVVAAYKEDYGHIDQFDASCSKNKNEHRTNKWCKRYFHFGIEVLITNVWLLYC